jgi:hypothetical protein
VSQERVVGGTQRDNVVLTIVGLLAAPIAASVICALALGLLYLAAGLRGAGDNLAEGFIQLVAMGAMGGAAFGLIPAFVLGLPAHLLLLRIGRTSRTAYALAGAGIGLIVFAGIQVIFAMPVLAVFVVYAVMAFVPVAGVIGALIFWAIRRPDRDHPTAIQPQQQTPLPQ